MKLRTAVAVGFTVIAFSALGIVSYKEYRKYNPPIPTRQYQRKIQLDTFRKRGQKRALATMDRCFSKEIFVRLMETEQSLSYQFDPEGKFPTNLNAWAIGGKRRIWVAIPQKLTNRGWFAKKGEVSLGGTSMTGGIAVKDETGSVLKNRLVEDKERPGFFELLVELNEPWKRGAEKTFYWVGQYRRGARLRRNFLGQYTLSIQQKFGPEAIQQLALVLPKGWKVAISSREPDRVEKVNGFTINIWAKHVQKDENHKVDVILLPE